MPLIERTKESMRQEFVSRALAHEKSKSTLCKEYGISRPTGDKWIKQYQQGESPLLLQCVSYGEQLNPNDIL